MMRSALNAMFPVAMKHAHEMLGLGLRCMSSSASPTIPIQWVFLGAPGVGKGTYASRAARHFNAAHIATGDLIRAEIKAGTTLGTHVRRGEENGGPLA